MPTYYRAVDAAHSAFQSWRTKSLSERKAAMQKVSDVFTANVDELAELLVLEQGKPLEAAKGEVMGVSYLLQKAMDIKNEPEVYSDTPERRVEVRRVPIGVVACITPWNFPLFCSVQKWAPAVSSWFGIIDVYGMYWINKPWRTNADFLPLHIIYRLCWAIPWCTSPAPSLPSPDFAWQSSLRTAYPPACTTASAATTMPPSTSAHS